MDALLSGRFGADSHQVFRPIWNRVLEQGDEYFHLADFDAFVETQRRAGRDFLDAESWSRRAILNVARVHRFSSDRAVREYAERIWGLEPIR
jgi:starch phosphorylase